MVLPSVGEVIEVYDEAINGWKIGKVVTGKLLRRGARNRHNPYFKVNLYQENFGSTKVYGGTRIRRYNPLVVQSNLYIGDRVEVFLDYVWYRGIIEQGVNGDLVVRHDIDAADAMTFTVRESAHTQKTMSNVCIIYAVGSLG